MAKMRVVRATNIYSLFLLIKINFLKSQIYNGSTPFIFAIFAIVPLHWPFMAKMAKMWRRCFQSSSPLCPFVGLFAHFAENHLRHCAFSLGFLHFVKTHLLARFSLYIPTYPHSPIDTPPQLCYYRPIAYLLSHSLTSYGRPWSRLTPPVVRSSSN